MPRRQRARRELGKSDELVDEAFNRLIREVNSAVYPMWSGNAPRETGAQNRKCLIAETADLKIPPPLRNGCHLGALLQAHEGIERIDYKCQFGGGCQWNARVRAQKCSRMVAPSEATVIALGRFEGDEKDTTKLSTGFSSFQ